MEKKEAPDKGVFTWGAFTAIMIIVIVAAVLVFIFKVKLNVEPEKNTTVNENVINETMIERGAIQGEDGNLIVVENATEELATEVPEALEVTTEEPAPTDEVFE